MCCIHKIEIRKIKYKKDTRKDYFLQKNIRMR